MGRSSVLVYLPAFLLAGLLLPATPSGAWARQQHPPGGLVEPAAPPPVYVVGSVVQQQSVLFKAPFTVTQAIAAAGGLRGDANKDRVCVIRVKPGDDLAPTVVEVDLKAIRKRLAPDFPLQPYDIVDVIGRSKKRCPSGVPPPNGKVRVIH